MDNRQEIIDTINKLELTGTGIEIGVRVGKFSHKILAETKLSRLISLDVWNEKKNLNRTYTLLEEYKKRSVLIKGNSLTSYDMFPDEFFDFIHIDSDHRYFHVKQELELYWPKLKKGGIYSGHDYMDGWWRGDEWRDFGVIEAVDEFVAQHQQKLHICGDSWKSWWFVKNPMRML